MKEKLIKKLLAYSIAFEKRFFLLSEFLVLQKKYKSLPKQWFIEIFRNPHIFEDRLNLLRFLSPHERILLIDAGGNTGYWAQEFVDLFPNTSIIAFEPDPRAYAQYTKRFATRPDCCVRNVALSNEEGSAEFHLSQQSTFSTLEAYAETQNDRGIKMDEKITVSKIPLDSIPISKQEKQRIVLKVDVQGHEIALFEGATAFLPLVDVVIAELSFANEYKDLDPSFSKVCSILLGAELFPIVFQSYGRMLSPFAWERDVIFVRRKLLDMIWNDTTSGGI